MRKPKPKLNRHDAPSSGAGGRELRIGLISDTHGLFDPAIPRLFSGVDHILHAGDIGPPRILDQLEAIAPVTAVLGNTDSPLPGIRETEFIELSSLGCLVHHIVDPDALQPNLLRRISLNQPRLILFGHTHKPFASERDGILFLNPGSAGPKRFQLPRSLAIGTWDGLRFRHEWIEL